jgi:hypothetical protein
MPIDPLRQAYAVRKRTLAPRRDSAEPSQAARARTTPPMQYLTASAGGGSLPDMGSFSPARRAASVKPTPKPSPSAAPDFTWPKIDSASSATAAKPEDEDFLEIPQHRLSPAENVSAGRVSAAGEPAREEGKRWGLALLAQLAALGAVIYLFKFSSLPYVLGVKRKP